jgi:hypothetical protein
MAKAFDKKWNPPSRFKTLGTPEERNRRLENDLNRAYGDDAWRALQQQRQPSPAPLAPPAPASPPVAEPKEKCDVLAVPMVCFNGIWGLDWDAARPAS